MLESSDQEAMEVGLYSALPQGPPRLCRIRNTCDLTQFWASEALLGEVRENPHLTVETPLVPFAFDAAGNLLPTSA